MHHGRIHSLKSGRTNLGEREERGAEGVGVGRGSPLTHRGNGPGEGTMGETFRFF